MKENFFSTSEVLKLEDILKLFKQTLEKFEDYNKIGGGFSVCFDANKLAIKSIIKRNNLKQCAMIFEDIWNKILPKIGSKNKYHTNKKNIFLEFEIKYIEYFRITNKDVFDFLSNVPEESDFLNLMKYFKRFLSVTTLMCEAFKLCISSDSAGNLKVVTYQHKTDQKVVMEYYMFYNRSHQEKIKVGIGSVKIERNKAIIKFYYKSKTSNNGFDTLNLVGETRQYPNASIIVLSHVRDTGKSDFYKSKEPVESFYVLKRYNASDENILLGVLSSWNRDKFYPISTAILLVEKNYYDSNIPPDYSFNIREMLDEKHIFPRIFYFLYTQTISFESVIDANANLATGEKNVFSTFDDIPFYKTESAILEMIAGKYKGLSIIPTRRTNRHMMILSELRILPTGIVELKTEDFNLYDPAANYKNKGFVKYIDIDASNNGKIYISLNYNFSKHYNALNHFLEFKIDDKKIKDNELYGAFAGESLVTNEPVSASVVFQKVEDSTEVVITKFEVSEFDKIGIDRLIELYNSHKSLFKFYYRESDYYTNNNGVNILRKLLPLHQAGNINYKPEKKYDVFISIPLSSSDNASEYNRNCDLVLKLKQNLYEEFGIDQDTIYCGCFDGEKILDFEQYKSNNKITIFEYVQEIIESIKTFFLLYPKRPDETQTHISSALVETGFALALKKTVIVFFDSAEENNLPRNLMNLSIDKAFNFDTDLLPDDPFKSMINSKNNYQRISKFLM